MCIHVHVYNIIIHVGERISIHNRSFNHKMNDYSPVDSDKKCRSMSEPEASNCSCGLLSSFLLSLVGGRVISGTPSVLPIGGMPEQNVVYNINNNY